MARNEYTNDKGTKVAKEWDKKLSTRGHRVGWSLLAAPPRSRWRGECLRCGREIRCGTGPATGTLRRVRCR
jgi:hypothetical protein